VVQGFVLGLFDLSKGLADFKAHLRDFLVHLKEFAGDNADLFAEEKEIQVGRSLRRLFTHCSTYRIGIIARIARMPQCIHHPCDCKLSLAARLGLEYVNLALHLQEQQAKQKAEMRLLAVPGLLPVHDPSRPDEGMAD
jgi:hypothetical protein